MDWRAVSVGVSAAVLYLGLLVFFPLLERTRWDGVALVLGTGLIAGATAGHLADGDAARGTRHGLLAGSLAGLAFAVLFWLSLVQAGPSPGVFHGLNHLLAAGAGRFRVVATHGRLVVAGLAVLGGCLIALLGAYAGRRAHRRGDHGLIGFE